MSDQTAGLTYKGRPLMRKDNMIYYGSMADGMICLEELGSAVPEDVAQQINDVKEQMENGEFEVFSGEIRYSDGTLLCEEGQTLTDEEIWQINKEVEGVTATSN